MQGLKLDIIHEDKLENFWDIKAHKGSKGSVIIGNVRDVEVMISGKEGNYDLVLRTGAWGKDIVVPAVIVWCSDCRDWCCYYRCSLSLQSTCI